MTARFVDVVLDIPTAQLDQAFTYESGADAIALGTKVRVPLGRRSVSGWVVDVRDEAGSAYAIRPVLGIESEPGVSEETLGLARWMQREYACTFREALSALA